MGTKEQIEDIRKKVLEGLTKTYEKLIETKKRNKKDLVISVDGKIVKVNPDDL